jgi:hypothetical protein
MTDITTSQNIDLSSWDILYNECWYHWQSTTSREAEKYTKESRWARDKEWLCWQRLAEIYSNDWPTGGLLITDFAFGIPESALTPLTIVIILE